MSNMRKLLLKIPQNDYKIKYPTLKCRLS